MTESLVSRVESTLSRIINPRTNTDVLTSSQVRDIATTASGRVRLTLLLHATDDATLRNMYLAFMRNNDQDILAALSALAKSDRMAGVP